MSDPQPGAEPTASDKRKRRLILVISFIPGTVAFALSDYLLSRNGWWALLLVPLLIATIIGARWATRDI